MTREKEVLTALVAMFEIYDMNPSENVFAIYSDLLKPYPIEEIKAAIRKTVEESKFKPTPAAVLEYLKPSEEDLQAHAGNEAFRVEDSAIHGNKKCMVGDDITTYLCKTRFNPETLADMSLDSFRWALKDFIKAYIDLQKSPDCQEKIGRYLDSGSTETPVLWNGMAGMLKGNSSRNPKQISSREG